MNSRGFIHKVHIADGFVDDCEELISRWLKTETLTYETFCEIWKDMKFGCLYNGRTSGAEVAELSEEVLQIAKHYMVANTSNFEESVAGVFLVYALVNLQPYPKFASVRIIPEDVPAINRIEMMARRQKRYDVLYILGSLLIEGPVQYHAVARERGMEPGIRKYLEGYTGIDRLGVRPRGVFYRQNEELDLLRELSCITRRYSDAKKAIGGENNRDLNYASESFPRELDASLKKIINGVIETTDDPSPQITKMQSIKDKAMKLTVDSLKYLRSATNKNKSPEKRNPLECEIKQKPGKVKRQSPRKPTTSLAKRKTRGKLPKRKRNRRYSSTSSSDEHLIVSSRESVISKMDKDNSDIDDANDFNIDSFSKEIPVEKEQDDKDNSSNKEKPVDNVEEREIHISIDSLPLFIREEHDGKMFEIEIIDKAKDVIDEKKEVENTKRDIKNVEKISLQNVDGEGTSSVVTRRSERIKNVKSEDSFVFIQRPERRDLKQPILKSKFKRMGMLKVANFKESYDKTDVTEGKKT